MVLLPKAAQKLLLLIEILLAVGDDTIGLQQDTMNVLGVNRTTRALFTLFLFTDALTHFNLRGKIFLLAFLQVD